MNKDASALKLAEQPHLASLHLDTVFAVVLERHTREDGDTLYWCVLPRTAEWVEVILRRDGTYSVGRALDASEAACADRYLPTGANPLAALGLTPDGRDASGGGVSEVCAHIARALDPGADLPTHHDVAPTTAEAAHPVSSPVTGASTNSSGGVHVLGFDYIIKAMG